MKKCLFIIPIMLLLAGCEGNGISFSLKSLEESLNEKSVEVGINLDSINSTLRKGYNKRERLAMGWYELGKTYSVRNMDAEAINALLKARELFTDTLSADYLSISDMLGHHYNNRGLYDDALNTFTENRRLYEANGDRYMVSMTDFNIGLAYFGQKEYSKSYDIFEKLAGDRFLDASMRNSCYLYMAYIENDLNHMDGAKRVLELADRFLTGCTA